jgi:uncharacterized delta-60 repeat protein
MWTFGDRGFDGACAAETDRSPIQRENDMQTRVLILAGVLLSAQASISFAAGSCSAGQLDSTYGSNGFVQISPLFTSPVGTNGDYEGIVHHANGDVFSLAPASIDSDGDTVGAVAMASPSGARDLRFGGFGTLVPGGQPLKPYGALATDAAGNLVAAFAGVVGLFDPTPTSVIVVNRYSASGVVDTTYGDGVSGVATIPLFGSAAPIDLRVAANKSVVIAASYKPSSAAPRVPVAVKLTPSGALDSTFGSGGVSSFYTGAYGPTGKATDVTILSNGTLLIAGRVGDNATYNQFFVARLLANGALDTSFGTGGMSVVSFGAVGTPGAIAFGRKMAVQSDGKIVVVGGLAQTGNGPSTGTGVIRLTSSGQLDTTFNGTGKVAIPPGIGGLAATNLALQDNDKILLAGVQFLDAGQTMGIAAVMRLTGTGQADSTFGTGGVATVASPLGGGSNVDGVTFAAANPSGNIVLNIVADDAQSTVATYLAQLDSGHPAKCH